jgi:hypothetical protein
MVTVLSEQDTENISETTLKGAVEAGFRAGSETGSTKAEFENSTRQELKTKDENTSITLDTIGGDPDDNASTWALSISNAPALLFDALAVGTDEIRPIFEPLWSLCGSIPLSAGEIDNRTALGEALKKATLAYLPTEAEDLPSLFGEPDGAVNQTFKAQSNGFCLLSIADSNPSSATLSITAHASESGASAPLVQATTQTLANADDDAWIASASLFAPVCLGNWITQSGPAKLGGFMPAKLAFGAWGRTPGSPVAGNVPAAWSAPSDGFVSVLVQAEDGPYGAAVEVGGTRVAECVVAAARSPSPGFAVARFRFDNNATVGYMCVPIPKGASVRVYAPDAWPAGWGGKGAFQCFWLPVDDPGVAFGSQIVQLPALPGSPKSLRHDFPSDTQDRFVFGAIKPVPSETQDRFVLGAVKPDYADGHGALSLAVVPASDDPPRPYAAAACHNVHGARISWTSLIAAVPRGRPWFANVLATPAVTAQLFVLPLVPRKS